MKAIRTAAFRAAVATTLMTSGALWAADDAEALRRRAEAAMGGAQLKSIRFVGSGTGAM